MSNTEKAKWGRALNLSSQMVAFYARSLEICAHSPASDVFALLLDRSRTQANDLRVICLTRPGITTICVHSPLDWAAPDVAIIFKAALSRPVHAPLRAGALKILNQAMRMETDLANSFEEWLKHAFNKAEFALVSGILQAHRVNLLILHDLRFYHETPEEWARAWEGATILENLEALSRKRTISTGGQDENGQGGAWAA